jgi:hypothetical protein
MDVNALNTIHRIDILKTIVLENIPLFKTTIEAFQNIGNTSLEEISCYSRVLELVQNGDVTGYCAELDVLKENCLSQLFDNPCEKRWSSLIATDEKDISFCNDCGRNVFKVYTKEDYIKRKQLNQCVAIAFQQREKYHYGVGCEFSFDDFVLLGLPTTIE